MNTYKAQCTCYNCGSKFLAFDEEELLVKYCDGRTYLALDIPKGTKIANMKCPKCGCESLGGELYAGR